MGLLLPTQATRNLIDTLNVSFYGPNAGLQNIRDQGGLLFGQSPNGLGQLIQGKQWGRGDLAKALNLLPSDSDQAQAAKFVRRWMHLLKQLPDSVFGSLKDALADAITNSDGQGKFAVARVSFDHVELEDPADPNDHDNPKLTPRIVIFNSPLPDPSATSSLGTLRHITLITQRVPKSVT